MDAELVANELTPAHKPKVSGSVVQTRRSMRLRWVPFHRHVSQRIKPDLKMEWLLYIF